MGALCIVQIIIAAILGFLSLGKLNPTTFPFFKNTEVGCTIYYVAINYFLTIHLLLVPAFSVERYIAVSRPLSRVGEHNLKVPLKVCNMECN